MSRAEGALKKKQQETTLKQGGRKDMQGEKINISYHTPKAREKTTTL